MGKINEVRKEKYTYNYISPCGSNLTLQTQVICCFHLSVGVESLFLECSIDFKACF